MLSTKQTQIAALLAACLSITCNARADVVTTVDGARLIGAITKITPKTVELKTTYAGALTVAMDQITSLSTDAALTTQLTDSTTVTGVTVLDEQKTIRVTSETLASSVGIDQLQASWVPGLTPPPESLFDNRHWAYTAGVDFSGKNGNSDEKTTNIVASMALVGKKDELRFYGSYQTAEQESNQTSDESIGGASYTAFPRDPWGWYVRGELEKDKFEDIDLRTTVATGLTWRPIHTDDRTLRFWLGVGYRHESFNNGVESDGAVTLDSGVAHHWQLKTWLTLDNSLAYAPEVEHFGNYLLTHDTAFVMPIGLTHHWTLRIGLQNDYNSQPAPDRDKLDTTYYTRLLLKFE